MAAKKHRRGKSKDQFCGTAGTPCKCPSPNDYRKVCQPSWSGFKFPRVIRFRKGKRKGTTLRINRSYEAHHILCVSSVASEIYALDEIDGIVRETRWCINASENMMAMPLWGHTVLWYTSQAEMVLTLGTAIAPPFQSIPQHDWDHNHPLGYTQEVSSDLAELARDVEMMDHEGEPVDLAGDLQAFSSKWRGKLQTRGQRSGGTHVAFFRACRTRMT